MWPQLLEANDAEIRSAPVGPPLRVEPGKNRMFLVDKRTSAQQAEEVEQLVESIRAALRRHTN